MSTVTLNVAAVPGTYQVTFTAGYAFGEKTPLIALRGSQPLVITVPKK